MQIIDHGSWTKYQPEELPEGARPGTLFCRRDSDGVDWYVYSRGENFQPGSVKIAAAYRDYAGGYVVGPAIYEVFHIFPMAQIVIEVTGYTGTDPQADFGNKVYNPDDGSFRVWTQKPMDMPPTATETKILSLLDTLVNRIEKLEKHK